MAQRGSLGLRKTQSSPAGIPKIANIAFYFISKYKYLFVSQGFTILVLQKDKKLHIITDQWEEDEGEDAGEEAHDGNPHDDFQDVLFVEGLVL